MTEYWVSQGNKWCDYCKIYISNNATSTRTHEVGRRHKDNVAKKLAGIKRDNAAKDKEALLALKDMGKIEMQANKSYERDLAAMQRLDTTGEELETTKKNYQYNSGRPVSASTSGQSVADTRNKGSVTGKWTGQEEALIICQAAQAGSGPESTVKPKTALSSNPLASAKAQPPQFTREEIKSGRTAVPKVANGPTRFARFGKGAASSLEVGKRKRVEKNGPESGEETAARIARESARSRMQEREESLLGLYHAF